MIKKIKIILAVLALPMLLLSFSNCGGSKNKTAQMDLDFQQNPPFKINEAYYQEWVAGIQEGGSGTNVHIVFSEIDGQAIIKNIYFRDKTVNAQNYSQRPLEYIGFFKNDVKKDVVMHNDAVQEAQNIPVEKNLFNLADNEAVISYTFLGKAEYFKVTNLSEKQKLAYPETNPNKHE